MAKKGKKFYVVWKGHHPGVYDSWDACRKEVNGVENAQYKSFRSKKEAEEAFKGFYEQYVGLDTTGKVISEAERKKIGEPVVPSVSVDAACSGNPGILEFRGVMTGSKKELFSRGPYPEGTVNIGEFLALVLGLALIKRKGWKFPIYSDSKTAIKWVKDKKVNTKLKKNQKNKELFDMIDKALDWLRKNDYSSIPILKWRTDVWGEIPADYGRK